MISILGLLIEDKIVLDKTPEERNGSTQSDLPINSNIIDKSSPLPPNPPCSGEIKALITPNSAPSSQNFLSKPSAKLTFLLRLLIFS